MKFLRLEIVRFRNDVYRRTLQTKEKKKQRIKFICQHKISTVQYAAGNNIDVSIDMISHIAISKHIRNPQHALCSYQINNFEHSAAYTLIGTQLSIDSDFGRTVVPSSEYTRFKDCGKIITALFSVPTTFFILQFF